MCRVQAAHQWQIAKRKIYAIIYPLTMEPFDFNHYPANVMDSLLRKSLALLKFDLLQLMEYEPFFTADQLVDILAYWMKHYPETLIFNAKDEKYEVTPQTKEFYLQGGFTSLLDALRREETEEKLKAEAQKLKAQEALAQHRGTHRRSNISLVVGIAGILAAVVVLVLQITASQNKAKQEISLKMTPEVSDMISEEVQAKIEANMNLMTLPKMSASVDITEELASEIAAEVYKKVSRKISQIQALKNEVEKLEKENQEIKATLMSVTQSLNMPAGEMEK